MTARLGIARWLSMLACIAALAPSVHAQSSEQPRGNDIVVTGKSEATPRAIEKQARSMTEMDLYYRLPLAQFQDKICPGIIGLPVEMASLIVDRIRYNAERIGIATAREDKCQPNIIVAIVRNGQEDLKALKDRAGYLFSQISGPDFRRLIEDPGPVHAWANTEVLSRQGDKMQPTGGPGPLGQFPVLNVAQSQSHIFLAHRLDITSSIVMIDAAAANGLSVVQLADYVTMRGFARTKAVEAGGVAATILSLFDPANGEARPMEMTNFDIAYLKSLYGGIPNMPAVTKIVAINRELDKLAAAEKAETAGERLPLP